MPIVTALILALSACSADPPSTAPPTPVTKSPQPKPVETIKGNLEAAPACNPIIDIEGRVVVGGRATTWTVPTTTPTPRLKVFGWNDDQVLVALKTHWIANPMAKSDGLLAALTCRTGIRNEVYREPGADLGHAVVATGGEHLYFSGATGLSLLDLRTSKAVVITTTPAFKANCWAQQNDMQGLMRDLPEAVSRSGNILTFQRGGPCGFQGTWVSEELEVRGEAGTVLGQQEDVLIEQPHVVSTVVAGGGETIWLGDAGRCDEPGVRDPATRGQIWRSTDAAKTWQKIKVSDPKYGDMATAARGIWTDLHNPGHLLVLSNLCKSPAGRQGGSLFRSVDNGESWTRIRAPRIIESADVGQNIQGAMPRDGDLNRLYIWTSRGVLRTPNFGDEWFRISSRAPGYPGKAAPLPPRYVQIGGYIFRATRDGLVRREHATRKLDRVFPKKENGR